MLWVTQTLIPSLRMERSLLSRKHNFSSSGMRWLIWGVLSVDLSVKMQRPKQSCWYLGTWVPQKHQTTSWDLQKRSSRAEQFLHLTNFWSPLILEIFWGVILSLSNGHCQFFPWGMKWRIYTIALHKQGLFLTSSYTINNAEQVSMQRSRESQVRHCPVIPSFFKQGCRRPHWGNDLLKDTFILQNILHQQEGLLTHTGRAESRVGNMSLVTIGLLKENMVGLGKFSFLKRNMNSISGCGLLGDGLDYCVCGIITGVSLV